MRCPVENPAARHAATLAALALAGCAPPSSDGGDTISAEASSSPASDASTGLASSTGGPLGPDDGTVTFYRDVLPIFRKHCTACHSPDNIAPFSVHTYEAAWPWRQAIAAAVEARTMPPWLPSPGCNSYTNDASLPGEDIATVLAWVHEDGPRGDIADAPPPAGDPATGLPRVDLVLSAPEDYVPSGSDDYRCFLLDWPHETPTYITGFHAVPSNLTLVHHVIAYRITPDRVATYEQLDADDPTPGYPCFGGPGGAESNPGAGLWLGAWAPGGVASPYPEGTGLAMDPGAKVVLQIHYNTAAGDGGADRTRVELMLAESVEREAFMLLWADLDWVGGNMPIPAGSPDTVHTWELDPTLVMDFLTDIVPVNSPFLIHAASHHMHTLGTVANHEIVRKGGDSDCLLDIKHWDFNWQRAARFTAPIRFQPGDVLRLSCQWDNTAGTKDVNWGEGTSDEMCLGVYYVTNP